MGSSRHPVNPVKLSQLALSYGFAGLLMPGTIPCSRSASMLLPTDVLHALSSSMILLLGPARLAYQVARQRSRSRFGIVSLMETAFRQGRARRMETSDKCEDL